MPDSRDDERSQSVMAVAEAAMSPEGPRPVYEWRTDTPDIAFRGVAMNIPTSGALLL